jgi:hypothetical protein
MKLTVMPVFVGLSCVFIATAAYGAGPLIVAPATGFPSAHTDAPTSVPKGSVAPSAFASAGQHFEASTRAGGARPTSPPKTSVPGPPQPAAPPNRPPTWKPFSEIRQAARAAGHEAVVKVWYDPKKIWTSTTRESYPQFYGRYWDEAHGHATQPPPVDETQKAVVPMDPARAASYAKTLAMTQAGRQALNVMKKYNVGMQTIKDSSAGYYNPETNQFYFGDHTPEARVPNTMIHEVNHARFQNTGLGADPMKMSRHDYVASEIDQEAWGDTKVAEAHREYARIDRRAERPELRLNVPLERSTPAYMDAYRKVIFEGRAGRQGKPSTALGPAKPVEAPPSTPPPVR